jgi:gamma-glutamyltranspeptidase/glutathione hydrolase
VLRDGGNAVDAAVTTALVLAVVFPEAGNLGGGGFAVLRRGAELHALDFREIAPAAAHRDLFLDAAGQPIRGASTQGPLAAGVPGSPAGLFELHRRFGKLPWRRVVEPARQLADVGFEVGAHLHARLDQDDVRQKLDPFPESAAFWRPDGAALPIGHRVRLPGLAKTLERYAASGPAGVVEGEVAAAIVAASKRHGGILTAADLASHRPVWREPLRFERLGWQFATMPLPSSGGVIVASTLGLLERWKWAEAPRFGAERWHLLAEALRRSFADRFLLGDPSTTAARLEDLLSPAWLDRRAATLDRTRATSSSALETFPTAGETTHLSVVDEAGDVVALTTTLNDYFGCGLWIPEAGFFLNDEMDDFTTAPGRPNLFGLVQGPANEIAPGKRMLSSMAPTLAWKVRPEGTETLVLGARGGSRIPTSTIQVLLAVILDGDDLQAAIDRPRLHHQAVPDQIEVEADTLSPETRAELERRGHRVVLVDPRSTPKVHAVRRFADGRVEAAWDPRGPGLAAAVRPRLP